MFTVLIRYQKTHREVLYPARSVEFVPIKRRTKGLKGEIIEPEDAGLLINHTVDGESCHLGFSDNDDDARDVFVMNEHGSTVARYLL